MAAEMGNEILDIWRTQHHFMRFVDGNRANCSITNLALCSPAAAMRNIDWAVDWDTNLSDSQVEFVRLNHEAIALFFDPSSVTPSAEPRRNRRSNRKK